MHPIHFQKLLILENIENTMYLVYTFQIYHIVK